MSPRYLQRERPEPAAPAAVTEARRKELAALQRAMPMQRLLGNGMEHSDAVALHAMADRGIAWTEAAAWLGEGNLARALRAEGEGAWLTARSQYRHAAACFRFGQSALVQDGPEKRALYSRALDAFAAAARLDIPATEKLEIPWRGAAICAWLVRPAGRPRPPAVIVFGGADGWREEYHAGAQYLVERGIAAVLVDGPGQGETRILRGLHLTAGVEEAYSAVVTALLADARLGDRVGIWGNSMGGNFAARTASADARIAACCVNGGTTRPAEILDRFPRFIDKLCAMTGDADPDRARAVAEALRIGPRGNRIACPLLVLHGVPDQIFLIENAQALYDGAPAHDKTMLVWDDGDHCIYNHSHEKHGLVADWFARHLLAG